MTIPNPRREKFSAWGFTLLMLLIPYTKTAAAHPLAAIEQNPGTEQTRVILAVADESLLASQIDGRIKHIKVRDGDRIKKGETLVTLDCAIVIARKKKMVAERFAAKYILEAQQKLHDLRSGSLLKIKEATANLAKAQADLEIINATIDMCQIKAPFSGLVVKRMVGHQQYVAKGTPLLEIIDDSTLETILIVPSKWLLWLQEGAKFTFRLDETNKNYTATVSHIGVRVDPASQTVNLKGRVHGIHPELRVGMGGYAYFIPSYSAPP